MTVGPSLSWLRIQFPSELEPDSVEHLLTVFHGLSAPGRHRPFIFEVLADDAGITHHVAVPDYMAHRITQWVDVNVPGMLLESVEQPALQGFRSARRLWMSTSRRPLRTEEPEAVSASLLTAIHTHGPKEAVLLQWILGPVRRGLAVPSNHPDVLSENWALALAAGAVLGPKAMDDESRKALREKQGRGGGWRAVGRVAVRASTPGQAHTALGNMLGAIRSAEAPGVRFGYKDVSPAHVMSRRLPLFWGLALSIPEMTGLAAMPLSDLPGIPVARRRARLLPIKTEPSRGGRDLAVSPMSNQVISIREKDILSHCFLGAPTGAGKSTLMTRLIAQDIAAGRSVIVIEPKSDLIAAVLGHIPERREKDVVVLDTSDAPVGFNPLLGPSPELVADQVLVCIKNLNDSWGVRLNEHLYGALLTVALTPGLSLSALPLLLQDDALRRRVVGKLDDPLGVGPTWAAFDRLSSDAREAAVAAVLNKVSGLVSRRAMRGVFGQAKPKFSLSEAFTGRKVVLVDLAQGVVGPDAARLYGTLLINTIANLTMGRSAVPPEQRHPVAVYIDELPAFVGIPANLGDMLAMARGLGVGFTLAAQGLHQLPPRLQADVMVNCRTKMVWATEAADAAAFARGQKLLTPDDFANLPAREVYVKVSVDSEVTPWMSGRTLPAPDPISDPARIRKLSRDHYGVDRTETDEALRALVEPAGHAGTAVGSRRRSS